MCKFVWNKKKGAKVKIVNPPNTHNHICNIFPQKWVLGILYLRDLKPFLTKLTQQTIDTPNNQ
jgi:hypothetical protein